MELVHISKKNELGDVKLLAAVQGLEAPEFSSEQAVLRDSISLEEIPRGTSNIVFSL